MIYRELLAKQLDEKTSDFKTFNRDQRDSLEVYLSKIKRLEQTSLERIRQILSSQESCGAIPSDELERHKSLAVSFNETWKNHEESRSWAFEILKNRTTFAVDGSQIPPSRDFSTMVAAIQVGWFENPHSEKEQYEKNVEFFILLPSDLTPSPAESRVSERRIHEEVRKTKEFLNRKQGWRQRGERMPLAFYDNTLLVPFPLATELKSKYADEMIALIRLSEETQVPLVGYVARSLSKDLVAMLDAFDSEITDSSLHFDADLLFPRVLNLWGERTIFLFSKRQGLTEVFGDSVGFVYLQTTRDSSPARLDIPSWIYQNGLLDEVLDVVRAECVVGLGYPYAIETADVTALLTLADSDIFYKAVQDFAKENAINFTFSRKNASKGRRR
jgi:NurA domain